MCLLEEYGIDALPRCTCPTVAHILCHMRAGDASTQTAQVRARVPISLFRLSEQRPLFHGVAFGFDAAACVHRHPSTHPSTHRVLASSVQPPTHPATSRSTPVSRRRFDSCQRLANERKDKVNIRQTRLSHRPMECSLTWSGHRRAKLRHWPIVPVAVKKELVLPEGKHLSLSLSLSLISFIDLTRPGHGRSRWQLAIFADALHEKWDPGQMRPK